MDVLRTPDERFAVLSDWLFVPRYQEVRATDGTALRFHYVDEGPRAAAPILLLHGNPSWSYLHRKMIRDLLALGHRVLALDLMGLGRSDKPVDRADYTLASHIGWVSDWLEALALEDVTLYCQDWGGLIGLNAVSRQADRFRAIVASNTGVPVGEGSNPFIEQWLEFSQKVPYLEVSGLVDMGAHRALGDAEKRAYDAPFPDRSYQAGALEFPLLIPVQPENPGVPMCRELWKFLEQWSKPFITVFGELDMVSPKSQQAFIKRVPGAKDVPHWLLSGAAHFIQEDRPADLVRIIDRAQRGDWL